MPVGCGISPGVVGDDGDVVGMLQCLWGVVTDVWSECVSWSSKSAISSSSPLPSLLLVVPVLGAFGCLECSCCLVLCCLVLCLFICFSVLALCLRLLCVLCVIMLDIYVVYVFSAILCL